MFLTNDNLRKMKKKEPPILGLSYRGLPNGAENNQNAANQIPNGPSSPQKRNGSASNSPTESGGPSNPSPAKQPNNSTQNGDAHSQISTDRESQSSSTLPKITNPLYGINAASQYLPNQPTIGVHNQVFNGYNSNTAKQKSGESTHYQQNKSASRLQDDEGTLALLNGVRKAPEGQDNESFVPEEELESPKDMIVSTSQLDMQTETSAATHYTTDNNGKINVHVTVMINAGTLADLKKQRAQIRNSSPTDSSMSPSGMEPPPSSSSPQLVSPSTPPPPHTAIGDVPRFSGNTGEVVGDARSHRCCVVM